MYTEFMTNNILILENIGDSYFSTRDYFDCISIDSNYTETFSKYDWIAFHSILMQMNLLSQYLRN